MEPLGDTRGETRSFVRFAAEVYRPYPRWVPPLVFDQVSHIRGGPFNGFGEKQLFMAYRDARPVARLSVQRNFAHDERYGAGRGFFGFFEALPDPEAVRALFDAGEGWARRRGCREMAGPMNFSIYEEIGLLVRGFDQDPAVMCPFNPPYYAELLADAGYEKEIDWFGFRVDLEKPLPPAADRLRRRVLRQDKVVFRQLESRSWKRDSAIVQDLFNRTWDENWGHLPMREEQWRYSSDKIRLAAVKPLSWVVEVDGRPAGFLLTVKDLNPALKAAAGRLSPAGVARLLWRAFRHRGIRVILMGFLPAFRNRGYDLALIAHAIKRGFELGYGPADCSQIVEDNHRMLRAMDVLGGERYTTYRIFRKGLGAGSG